ncbi:MAG: hypothetical protein LBL26_03500 [Peptococcaceae bacterium]|nr:hypothetical protein [Peptococcaceae bacterium]
MKKFTMSKSFAAGTLAILCAVILTACAFWGKGDKGTFVPDDPVPLAPIDHWTENAAAENGKNIAADGEAKEHNADSWRAGNRQADSRVTSPSPTSSTSSSEAYPAVVEKTSDAVVVDFTDPNPPKEAPPATPGTNPDHNPTPTQPSTQPPTQPSASVEPPQPSPTRSAPVPEGANDKGEVYDPVFGWVKPSKVIKIVVDSKGDPNKMVGRMN